MAKKAVPRERAAYLRSLARSVAAGRLYADDKARAVFLELERLADSLEAPAPGKGRPSGDPLRITKFMRIECLLMQSQSALWRKNKRRPSAQREVRALTGWSLPPRRKAYTESAAAFLAATENAKPEQLEKWKRDALTWVRADRRGALAEALGLRIK